MNAPRRICTGCREGEAFDVAFAMAFQPIVDIATGRPFAYEALVRGPSGEPAPTVLGLVDETNRYAFDQACRVRAIETAMAAGIVPTGARLSINFLPNSVYSPLACIQLTLRTANACGFPLDRLMFEFLEHEAMAAPDHVASIIDTYRRIGFSVAIDDFGSGQSGLVLFARFTPDAVKLDMDLVRGVDTSPRRQAIVRAVVGLCAELGTTLIAEGIETVGECETLSALGVRYQQGFLFARPAFEALPEIRTPALG